MRRPGHLPKTANWVTAPIWVSAIILVSAAILATVRLATLRSSPADISNKDVVKLEATIKTLQNELVGEKAKEEAADVALKIAIKNATAEAERLHESRYLARVETDKRQHIEAEFAKLESKFRSSQENVSAAKQKYREIKEQMKKPESQRLQQAEERAHVEAEKRRRIEVQLAQLESKLQQAQDNATAEVEKREQFEAKLQEAQKSTGVRQPFDIWFHELPYQNLVAIVACIIGLLSIAGPSTFLQCFLPVVGSTVGSLMVGSSVNYINMDYDCFLDSVGSLLGGTGHPMEYLLWLFLFSMGILRWLLNWECALYAVIEEVDMSLPNTIQSLQKPLLNDRPQDHHNSRPPAQQGTVPNIIHTEPFPAAAPPSWTSEENTNGQRPQPTSSGNSNIASVPQPVTPTLSEIIQERERSESVQHDVV